MRKFIGILTILGLLTALCAARGSFAQTSSTQILLERARNLENHGHLELAARVWKQVLLSDPDTVEALTGLARFAEQQGNATEAKMYLDKAKAIDPEATAAPHSSPLPRSTVDSTILTPDQNARLQEAARLSADQKSEEAMQLYREVFKDRPPDGDLALAYYETMASTPGGRERAIAKLQELANHHPEDLRYRLTAARLLTYSPQTRAQGLRELESIHGDPAEMEAARIAWRQVLVWEKGTAAYEGSLLRYLKLYPDSSLEEAFGPIKAQRPPEETARDKDEQAAFKALQQGNIEDAELQFEKLRATSAADPRTLMGLGFVRMKQQRFAEAVDLLEAASALSPQKDKNLQQALETARFWKNMQEGAAFLEQDRFEQASASFHQALLQRPDNPDAIRGIAGTLMKEGEFSEAAPMYRKLIDKNSADKDAWKSWLRALQQSGDPAGAIAGAKAMPATVRTAFADDPELLVILAAAYEATGGTAQSRQLLQKAIELTGKNQAPAGTQMQMASLLAQAGMITQATEMYVRLADQNPQSLDVWLGLMAALHAAEKDSQALAVSLRMPRALYQEATKKADFLSLMASIYEAEGQLEPAHRFLEQAIQMNAAGGKEISVSLQLQAAGLWLREKEYSKAAEVFDQVIRRNPENTDAWRGALTSLHAAHRDDEVIADFSAMDPGVRDRLLADPIISGLLAGAYAAQGQKDVALRMIRRTAWQYESMRKPLPVDLQIQTCWILMDAGEDSNLNSELRTLTARKDLTTVQAASAEQIWAAWSQKRSERLASLGEYHEALSILYAARRAFPADMSLRASFANMLLRAGYTRRSYEDYVSWGLVGASRDDYLSGIGAAMSVREFKTAEVWLQTALRQWPDDSKILLMGAKVAAARGDYGKANKYYQAARLASPPSQQDNLSSQGGESSPNQAVKTLADLLAPVDSVEKSGSRSSTPSQKSDSLDDILSGLPGGTGTPNTRDFATSQVAPPATKNSFETESSWDTPGVQSPVGPSPRPARISSGSAVDPLATRNNSLDLYLNSGSDSSMKNVQERTGSVSDEISGTPVRNLAAFDFSHSAISPNDDEFGTPGAKVANPASYTAGSTISASPHSEVQSEIDAMSAQFSPYVGLGGFVSGRSGQSGFDHLIDLESDVEASTTLGNEVRLTAIARPVVLDAGAPASNATLQLGTLPLKSSFTALGASGLGGEVQVATQNFDARLGVTPQGFLVSNFLGGIDFRPAGGPVQISLTRDPVRDTLLSYAGIRDPGTNQVWGGVIANGASGTASWNMVDSGLYAQLGYQYITGDQVETNHKIDGTTGAYWRVLTRPYGTLTVGMNFSAMHYDENLRYFTLGQGGYFSPQSYFLFNVPLHWTGTYHNRFEYSVDASFGSQHFSEDSTPYYPLEVGAQTSSAAVRTASTRETDLHIWNPPATPTPIVPAMPYYPGQTVTSVNYSLTLKGGYRLTQNWFLDGFVDLNNALDYSSRTLGICARYQLRPTPLDTPLTDTAIPEWNSIRKLILP